MWSYKRKTNQQITTAMIFWAIWFIATTICLGLFVAVTHPLTIVIAVPIWFFCTLLVGIVEMQARLTIEQRAIAKDLITEMRMSGLLQGKKIRLGDIYEMQKMRK